MNKFLLPIILAISMTVEAQKTELTIVPMPASVEQPATNGSITISKNTPLVLAGSGLAKSAAFLNSYLQEVYGFQLKIAKTSAAPNAIVLNFERLDNELPGAYNLTVNKQGVRINGDNETGVFYGIQTLIQLLPAEKKALLTVPFVVIKDKPRFAYRGMHLDVSRHFMPVSFVKKYIDYLALHKLNNFHWHLTDDQGWRIEIKKYPKLTEVGSCREQTLIGRYGSNKYDAQKYCGFYTQAQIKEVVKYAADRYINVIPEIEMPGHALAAISAYPELSCTPDEPKKAAETWGVFEDVFCPTETTFNFLQNVIDEVITLFPSKYIHIGGDESPKEAWKRSAFAQQLIKDKGLKDEHGLQSYFIQRMEKYINSKGKNIIGWDEILEGGLAPNATVMSWRGEEGGIEAAKQGHDVIMTPGGYVYFDHSQALDEDSVTFGGFLPLEKVYSYEPIPPQLTAAQAKHILGAQANLWTEYIHSPKKAEYMIFPRLSALSEVLWSPKEKRDWKNFEARIPGILKKYQLWNTNYSKAYFNPDVQVLPAANNEGVVLKVNSKMKTPSFYFGNKNTGKYQLLKDSVLAPIRESGIYGVRMLGNKSAAATGEVWGPTRLEPYDYLFQSDVKISMNKATGKKLTLATPPSSAYPGHGAFTLVDGIQNDKGLGRSSEFLGFSGKDLDVTIDLGKTTPITKVTIHVMDQQGSWIYLPSEVEITYLPDSDLTEAVLQQAPKKVKQVDPITETGAKAITIESGQNCRYVHIVVKHFGVIPAGNPGAGNAAWLFVDEIEID
ncbi:MAG: beta-N-acetylhexosaminidase [Ferruginibacter sp.]|nr:beta-N-acetylhexosaminidase [Ferruginibacter sp.]